MKITTWNVNGYRAVRAKGALDWVRDHQPDILCLQEVKVQLGQLNDDLRNLPDYLSIWNPATRPGYSGVASFFRTEPLGFQLEMGEERFDIEGRIIYSRHPGFILFNVYFPNGQRGQDRLGYKMDFYAALLAWCNRLHAAGEQIVITGDFNTAHREIDLAHPKQNETNSGFLPEERAWIDRYLENGFVDAYRHIYPERVEYTWWTYRVGARDRNVGWRLDYFLISPGLMDKIVDVVVHKEITGSDHCPVSLIMK